LLKIWIGKALGVSACQKKGVPIFTLQNAADLMELVVKVLHESIGCGHNRTFESTDVLNALENTERS
jgi:hypothetical protein